MDQNITVKIAGKEFSLTVDSSMEERVRQAVDKLRLEIESLQYDYHGQDLKDILSVVLLSEEVNLVNLEMNSKAEINNTLQKLEELDSSLGDYLYGR